MLFRSVLSPRFFRALISVGFSKQNGHGFHRLRAVLKRHPCPFPLGCLHSAKKNSAENEARKNRGDSTGAGGGQKLLSMLCTVMVGAIAGG